MLSGISGYYLVLLSWMALFWFAKAFIEFTEPTSFTFILDTHGWCWFVPQNESQIADSSSAWVISEKSRVFAEGVFLQLTQPKKTSRYLWILRGECSESSLRRLARVIVRLTRQPISLQASK